MKKKCINRRRLFDGVLKKWKKVKLLITFFFFGLLGVSASTYSQQVKFNLDLENVTVREVFEQIEQNSEFVLFYNKAYLNLDRKVDIKIKGKSIDYILEKLFLDTNNSFKIYDRQIVILPPVQKEKSKATENQAREKTLIGRVTDENGIPLPGASVVIKGTTIGTATDIDGKFTLSIPTERIAYIVVQFIGYEIQEIEVGERQNIQVKLISLDQSLDEIVVIGYGGRSKRDVTSAISNVGEEKISKTISMSAENAMQGTMSGVQVAGTSGNPMHRPTIRIRGTNTWGVSSPLYVVDGIPITEMGAGIEGEHARIQDVRGPLNIMSMIDPSDIESISVLKDASAAAIYGVRAANGVVLITTKKGRQNKPTVDFTTRFGIQNITQDLEWLSTPEYTKFVQGVFASDPERNPSEDNVGRFDSSSPLYLGNSPTYNWGNAVKNKNALTKDYSIKVSGGTDNVDYYVSLGYSDTEGTILVNNLERYSGAVKINTKISQWISTGVNYRLVNALGKAAPDNYLDLVRSAPWQPIYSADGIPGYNGYAYAVGGIQPDGSYANQKLYGAGTRINEVGRSNTNDTKYDSWRNMGSIYLELTPLSGLKIKGTISLDRYTTTRYSFRDYDANGFDYTSGDSRALGGGKSVGSYGERDTYNNNMVQELMANYANQFGAHNIDFLFNFSNQKYDAKYRSASTEYMTTKKDYLRNLGGERNYTSVQSEQMRWALQGYLFRVGYNYAYKYYLDVTVRRDGSARFAPENRWGTFPSLSAAWRLKNESFMEQVTWLDDFKLRAGWGQLGNQEVRDMAYLSAISKAPHYAMGNATQNDRPSSGSYHEGATIFGIPNRELTWEKTETFNIGFDSQIFNNLTLSAEYYYKETHGILQSIDIPSSVGVVETPVANVAKVQNQGVEITADWQGKIGQLNYSIGANLTTTANKVLETYKHIPTSGGTVEEGYSMFYHKAYKVAGIFQTNEEAQEWMQKYEDVNYISGKVGAGDFYFEDLRGAPKEEGDFYSEGADGKIDSYDMVNIGKSIPGYFYGINFNADYKRLDFSLQFSGVGDVVKYNRVKALTFMPTEGDNVTTIVYQAWTTDNKQNEYPRLIFGDPAGNLRSSNFFYESGAYLRLQNIQVGYALSQLMVGSNKKYARNLRIFAGASNLFTLTPYTGLDPENDSYPAPQTVYMGLSAKF
ncbi:TonB-linked outer membrane protein, SusC/RagA family [Mariniphaga anaerophila]|uniref:TonB-linked outer membrane protein, SusC/RagA family n=1 Tax=Mariniphaga anaerophila TaxID=1484053 RepID=A0A1M4YZB6_9BACT|nr:TonB-dependent receptor [Mariniphaga anaerophila]SHF11163.1 TonB-linked outer membrane protein, SusC/RagA family [Mariniphaga anaerophila]